ncbi:Formin-like protein [Melia azedarach]|uniref:Formin-like protein n=1 Tax=Melia azedarach TaxID=155640 RepID=A0ACC1XQ78_MELAZ|nr:Formin-like protein [Melia azedarach]
MLQDDEILGGLLEQQIHLPSKQRSMITIRDSLPNSTYDDCAVFPPVNHENLHIPSHNHTRDQQKQHHPPSDLVTRPILSSTSKQVFIGWLDFALDILRAKICCIYSWRSRRESVEHLKLVIKHKDEKISELLHQIAQMNQVLVARHIDLASKLAN